MGDHSLPLPLLLQTTKIEFTMKIYQIALFAVALPQVIYGDLASDLKTNGLTTLLDLVVKADLASTLGSVEPATIFAPTNEAFDAVPQDTLNALLADTELLKNVLLYHVIPNVAIQSSELKADQSVETANGAPLRVNVFPKYETVVTVNGVPSSQGRRPCWIRQRCSRCGESHSANQGWGQCCGCCFQRSSIQHSLGSGSGCRAGKCFGYN